MKLCTLFSGSSGNCTFIQNNDTKILIDAGRNMKTIKTGLERIGVDLSEIDAILLTHAHSDHTGALRVLSSHYSMPILGRRGTLDRVCEKCGDVMPNRFTLLEGSEVFSIGSFSVTPFATPHDAPDSTGYSLADDCAKRLTFVTDLGYVTDEIYGLMKKSDFVVIEANYDPYMLENGPYTYDLKQRIKSNIGHLSNNDCAATVCRLVNDGVKHFMLAHLSDNNNTPSVAMRAVIGALADMGAKPGDVTVNLAPRYDNSDIFDI